MYTVGQKVTMYSYRELKQDEVINIKRKGIYYKLKMLQRIKDNKYEFEVI